MKIGLQKKNQNHELKPEGCFESSTGFIKKRYPCYDTRKSNPVQCFEKDEHTHFHPILLHRQNGDSFNQNHSECINRRSGGLLTEQATSTRRFDTE